MLRYLFTMFPSQRCSPHVFADPPQRKKSLELAQGQEHPSEFLKQPHPVRQSTGLFYTSDPADDPPCVDPSSLRFAMNKQSVIHI